MYGFILDNLFFSDSLKQELSSMAQICNLDYYEALFANFMYEYNTGCTSIIVK